MHAMKSIAVVCVLLAALAAAHAVDGADAAADAAPRFVHVPVHAVADGWARVENAVLPRALPVGVTFALTQRNMGALEALVERVSDPAHAEYGQFLTIHELTDLIAPADEVVDGVVAWLAAAGHTDVYIHTNRDFIDVELSVAETEALFATQMVLYKHADTEQYAMRAQDFVRVPEALAAHIDFIGGVSTAPQLIRSRKVRDERSYASEGGEITRVIPGDGEAGVQFTLVCPDGSTPAFNATLEVWVCTGDQLVLGYLLEVQEENRPLWAAEHHHGAAQCAAAEGKVTCAIQQGGMRNYVGTKVRFLARVGHSHTKPSNWSATFYLNSYTTVDSLKAYYNIPRGLTNREANNSASVAEFLGQYYSDKDLDNFFASMSVEKPAQAVELIGPNDQSKPGGEANLDIQYLMGLAGDVKTTFWSIPGNNSFGQEPFLLWAKGIADMEHPPLVHSVSYGDDEFTIAVDYQMRVNNEFLKFGARGISILISSGDDGVINAGARGHLEMCDGPFRPSFPCNSPYVTAVGATQLTHEATPICKNQRGAKLGRALHCTTLGEKSCDAATGGVITVGGGFSNVFARPAYQEADVAAYLARTDILPPADKFNATARGYPDVSVIGNNYIVFLTREGVDNPIVVESGTSASAPVMSAMVVLLNQARLAAGKAPMGFITPWLYHVKKHFPEAFYDVTMGNNRCLVTGEGCCPHGFDASIGWDPLSGVGTPRFDILLNIVLNPDARFPSGNEARVEVEEGAHTASHKANVGIALGAVAVSVAAVVAAVVFVGMRKRSAAPGDYNAQA